MAGPTADRDPDRLWWPPGQSLPDAGAGRGRGPTDQGVARGWIVTFEAALPTILRHEGGYVDHPQDPGGATNYGITQTTYDGWRGVPRVASRPLRLITQEPGCPPTCGIPPPTCDGWRGVPRVGSRPVRLITQEEVRAIYLERYWRPARCADLPPRLRLPHFDCGVNCGVAQAAKILQRALGVADDGIIWQLTLRAANERPSATVVDDSI